MNRFVSFFTNALSPTGSDTPLTPNSNNSWSPSPLLMDFGVSEEERQVEDFFNQTALGSTLRVHLHAQLNLSSAPSSPMSPSLSRSGQCAENVASRLPEPPLDPTAEELVYTFWAPKLSEATRQMVEYGDAALATSCGDAGSSLHLESARHKQVWEGRQSSMFYHYNGEDNASASEKLPRQIQKLFSKRWRTTCKFLENIADQDRKSDSTQTNYPYDNVLNKFPFFLSRIIPGWCAMLEVHATQWSESLRCKFVEQCVLPSLLLLQKIAVNTSSTPASSTTASAEEHVVSTGTRQPDGGREEENPEESDRIREKKSTRHRDMAVLVALQRLLHFLHLLLLREPVSSLSTEQGVTAVFVPNNDRYSASKQRSLAKLEYLIGGKVALELLSFFSLLSKGSRKIFDCFSVDEEEGCDFELTTEAVISSSFSVAMSIVSFTFPHSELHLVVKSVLTAVNMVMYRLTHLHRASKPLMYLMLRQLTPAMNMLSKAIRMNLVITVHALRETDFHVLLAETLRVLGQTYESHASNIIFVGGGDDLSDAEEEECMNRLTEFAVVPIPSSLSTTTTSMSYEPTVLGVVQGCHRFFTYVAEDEMVNDFLEAVFTLRAAQRSSVGYVGLRRIPPDILSYFRLLDGVIMETLLNTHSSSLLAGYSVDEEPLVSESCMASFLCKYMIELLSWTELGGYNTENKDVKVDEFRFLVNHNLYELLLNHDWMRSAMQSNKRIMFTVVRIFYALAHYSADTTSSGFTLQDQQTQLIFLLKFVCNSEHIYSLSNSSGYGNSELTQALYSICCAILSHCFHGQQDAIVQSANEIKGETLDKELLSGCLLLAQLEEKKRQPSLELMWLIFLSDSLLEDSSTFQARALLVYPEILIGLVCETHTRNVASMLLIQLLRSYSLAYVEGQAVENSIADLVYAFWNAMSEGRIVDDGAHAHYEKVLALLNVMNAALDIPPSNRVPRNFYTSRSNLQDQFCGANPRCFVLLIDFMRASSSTLHDPLERFRCVSIVFRSLFYFVRGNNDLRRQLTNVINIHDFFQLCKDSWQCSSQPSCSFAAVVQSFLHFVYEDNGDPVTTHFDCVNTNEQNSVLNPKLLVPVLLSFSQPKHFNEEYEVLVCVLNRLTASSCSPTECYFLAKAGILNALSRLLPLCAYNEVTDVASERCSLFRKSIIHLMSLIAAQQIDVRHIKYLISTNLISVDYSTRKRLLPVVAEILSTALQHAKEKGRQPQSYIAFRPNSGRVGVRAEIPQFPQDGYAVSMWFHCETNPQHSERTLFTVENSSGKTMMKCFINGEDIICISSLDKYKNNVETVLGAAVQTSLWSHIAVVHHRPGLLQVEGKFDVFLNGVCVASRALRYPQHDYKCCKLYVGSPGDIAQFHRHTGLFVGQVTNVYFFPKPLTEPEVRKLFSTSLPNINPIAYRKGSYESPKSSVQSQLQYNLGKVMEHDKASLEMLFAEKASIFVDPRVGDENQLYNVAYFLQGSGNILEKPLMMYEGTVVVSGTSDIQESLCLTDVVNCIIMPMLALLVDARLPFPQRWTSLALSKPLTDSHDSPENILSVLLHVIDITISLSSLTFMQECMASSGVFVLLCYVLERVASYVSLDIPDRIMYLCQCFETRSALFGRVYSALFLCSDTIRVLPEGAQRKWWQCQIVAARTDIEGRGTVMRSTGIQLFAVQELLYNMEHQKGLPSLQEDLLNLLDVLTAPPITQGDATPLLYLAAGAHAIYRQNPDSFKDAFVDILFRIRLILYGKSNDLARYLSQCGFMSILFSLLSSSASLIRREAILMMCLLLQRATGVQRLMNPALDSPRVDVVHSQQYVDLGWLGSVLSPFPLNTETYMTLRSGLTGDRITRRREAQYKGLSENLKTEELLPHMLFPLSQQLVECPDTEVKVHAAIDMANLIQNYRGAARKIASLGGWYRALIDLYCSHSSSRIVSLSITHLTESGSERPNAKGHHGNNNGGQCTPHAEAHTQSFWNDSEMLNTNILTAQLMMQNCAAAIGTCLLHVMMHESYGAAECREVCSFMYFRGAHALLNRTLDFLATGLLSAFASKTHEEVLEKDTDYTNFFQLFYMAEDYIFHAPPLEVLMDTNNLEFNSTIPDSSSMSNDRNPTQPMEIKEYLYMTPYYYAEYEESEPEGWLHMPLALHLCILLCSHKTALKEEEDLTVIDWITGHSSQDGYRKGGLSRIFTRLMRVAASHTLRCEHSLQSLLQIGHYYCAVVRSHMRSLWNIRSVRVLTQRESTDIKSHSAIANTMSLIYIFSDLLMRRIHVVFKDKIDELDCINEEIMKLLKQLYSLFSTEFNLFLDASRKVKHSTYNTYNKHITAEKWFSDAGMMDVCLFMEVVNGQDYQHFLAECFTVMQEGRLHDSDIERLTHQTLREQCEELKDQLRKSAITHEKVLNRLRRYEVDHRWNYSPQDSSERLLKLKRLTSEFSHHGQLQTTAAMRSSVWTLFRARMKGSMWWPSTGMQGQFTRLSLAEQNWHCHRKLLVDDSGTDHREAARQQCNDMEDQVESNADKLEHSYSEVNIFDTSSDEDPEYDEDHGEETSVLRRDVDVEEKESGTALSSPSQLFRTFSCEMIYMLQSWSATLTIDATEVCVIIDDENHSHNSPVAKEAEKYIMRPESSSFPLNSLTHIAPGRRYRMQRNGLELWFRHQRSIFLNFLAPNVLINVVSALSASTNTAAADVNWEPPYIFSTIPSKEPLRNMKLSQWRNGALSNFDYLMWLNFLAGRSTNDLSQYPIFPWVLKNYDSEEPPDLDSPDSFRDLSKPMGIAGGEERERVVRERYEDQRSMHDVPAHYCSHYSSPSVMTFFMLRLEPFTSLHLLLQGGTFDYADRLFYSVSSTYKGVTTNLQDVRELIPEMYYLPELCYNFNRVPFGVTSRDKIVMNDLILPPWAHGCPFEFIYRMREALESDYVSTHLHHWIDLIFGCKQKGKKAVEAMNVFQWYTYEDLLRTQIESPGMTDFCDNMGQTPIQIFKSAHPERRVLGSRGNTVDQQPIAVQFVPIDNCPVVAHIDMRSGDRVIAISNTGTGIALKWSAFSVSSSSSLTAWRHTFLSSKRPLEQEESSLVSPPSTMEDPITPRFEYITTPRLRDRPPEDQSSSTVRTNPCTTSDSMNAVLSVPSFGRFHLSAMSEDGPCVPRCTATLSFLDHSTFFAVQGGLLDNTVVVRPLVCINKYSHVHLRAHHGHVTHVAVSEDSSYICTGARDTTFVVWACTFSPKRGLSVDFQFIISSHDENPGAVALCRSLDIVVTASVDGVMFVHSLSGGYMDRRLHHPLQYSVDHLLIQYDCYVPNILFASDTDSTIHQMSINGVFLRSFRVPGKLTAWCSGTKQYVVIAYMEGTGIGYSYANIDEQAATSFITTAMSTDGGVPVALYLHSFFLTTLNKVYLPPKVRVTTLASDLSVSPRSQTVLFGTKSGMIGMLQV